MKRPPVAGFQMQGVCQTHMWLGPGATLTVCFLLSQWGTSQGAISGFQGHQRQPWGLTSRQAIARLHAQLHGALRDFMGRRKEEDEGQAKLRGM